MGERPYHAVSILLGTLGLFSLGFFALGKSERSIPIQSPPSVLTLGEDTYFVSSSRKIGVIPQPPVSAPCTVVHTSSQLTPESLLAIRDKFSRDDVWKADFLQSLIIKPLSSLHTTEINTAAQQILNSWGTHVLSTSFKLDVPEGPYFCKAGDLHQVYRLYPDTAEAFMSATIQSPDDPYLYQYLNVSTFMEEYPTALSVAVPSRLHYTPTEDKPLAALRIAVKDTQDVRGIKTTGSSRAYAQLYGPREASSTGVQRLLDKGAIVIGKLKATQFGEAEFATRDWVDYHPPWNPRADGYQTPSASSSGSGVAMAAYDWLDLATGTDCSGSIRAPAAVHGLFGIRPSTDAIDSEGVIPFSKNFDTFGVFTRDIGTLVSAAETLYTKKVDNRACFKKPKRIIYLSEYWPVEDFTSADIFEQAIQRLEDTLDTKRTVLSLSKLWSETNTETTLPIDDYLNTTFVTASAPDQWDMLSKFTAEYENEFGHPPQLNPQLQFKMEFLPGKTIENQEQGEKEVDVFRKWFEREVMQTDENGCSETVLVLPWSDGQPHYRDEYDQRPSWTGEGWFFYFISVYAGTPEIVLPIGQTPYHSRGTKREEWLPVAISIIGPRGSDAAFTAFIQETLYAASLPTVVDVGRTAFKVNTSTGRFFGVPAQATLHGDLK